MPAAFYARWPPRELFIWSVRRAFYCLPTHELVEFIRSQIDCEDAIEIGSGNGCLGRSVGVRLTDSKLQDREDMKARYEHEGQATVTYGADVEKLSALEAVEKYKPKVVLAAWVTHKFNPARPQARGNVYGVDEGRMLDKKFVKKYVFVGNEHVHGESARKPILGRPHATYRLPYNVSRSLDPRNVVWVWSKTRR